MRNQFKEDSIYTRIVNEARYLNISVMFVVQSALSIPPTIREAASIVFCKRINDKAESKILKDMMNLSTEEQINSLIQLQRSDGLFINKEKGSIPVSVINPAYQVVSVTDELINNHQSGYIDKILNSVVREKTQPKNYSVENDTTPENKRNENANELNYNFILLIQDLKRFPFDFQPERSNRLNINVSIISKTLTDLIKLGLIEKYKKRIKLGKGKSPFQPYLFTEKAINKFGKQNIHGKGSLGHSFWQYRCKKYFTEKNFKTEIEYYLDEYSSIDVVAQKNKKTIAIEIELNKTDHIQANILKCINKNFSQIIIAVYDSALEKYIKNILLSNTQIETWYSEKRINVKILSEFLD